MQKVLILYESFTDSRPAIESKKQVVIKGFKKNLIR